MGWLKKLVGFENLFSKNFTKDIISNPTRLLTGIDPLSTKVWNKALGRDDQALVNVFGSPGSQYYQQAQDAGMDVGPARGFHKVADAVAGIYGAQGLAGIGGAGAGAGAPAGGAGAAGGSGAGAIGTSAAGFGSGAGLTAGAGATGSAGAGATVGGLGGLWNSIGGAQGAGGLLGAVAGALDSKNQPSSETITTRREIDPRMASILFGGSNGNGPQAGLLSRFQGFLDQDQSPAMKQFGDASGQYLQQNGVGDMNAMRNATMGLLGWLNAPQSASGPQVNAQHGSMLWNTGESINAPSQNNINLSGSYNSLVNGPAGANPFLTGAIGKGINQSANAFGAMQRDSTKNLLESVMPSIRGGAVLAGGYGGSRQGIAEGRALESFATEQQRAISQFGQNNTDAAVAAQAGAYDADRNRQLAATQGLGAQQYGVASQNAQMRQQANMANQALGTNMSQFNAQQGQNAQQVNAGMAQQNNQFNAGLQQQNNQLNTNRAQAGIGGLSGLLGTAYTNAGNQDAYGLNRASQVNGLLQPYLGMGGGTSQTTPLYNNQASGILGGSLLGMQIGQGLSSMFNRQPGT